MDRVLGIDVGNSSIKSAVFHIDRIDEFRSWDNMDDLLAEYSNWFVVMSAVGKAERIENGLWLDHRTSLPLKIDYETPETLGADRLAAAVGAWSLFPNEDILIIDGGTCVTYDLVTSDGTYRGGIISPGMEMRLKAMNHFTAGLPVVEVASYTEDAIGKSTRECMQRGAHDGLKNEIEGFLASFNKKHHDLQVVTTGGLLPSFESDIKKPIFASSKIVLTGLHAIWKFNEGN